MLKMFLQCNWICHHFEDCNPFWNLYNFYLLNISVEIQEIPTFHLTFHLVRSSNFDKVMRIAIVLQSLRDHGRRSRNFREKSILTCSTRSENIAGKKRKRTRDFHSGSFALWKSEAKQISLYKVSTLSLVHALRRPSISKCKTRLPSSRCINFSLSIPLRRLAILFHDSSDIRIFSRASLRACTKPTASERESKSNYRRSYISVKRVNHEIPIATARGTGDSTCLAA